MKDSLHKVFTEITTGVSTLVLLVKHGEEVTENLAHWAGLRKFITRQLGDRRKIMSVLTVLNGIQLAEKDALALSMFLVKIPTYAPVIQKQFADLQKAEADRNNPVALMADTSQLLADLNQDMALVVPFITSLIPALKTGSDISTPDIPKS